MKKFIVGFLLMISGLVIAGYLQNEDFKTEAELISAGGTKAQLLNDTKIYVTGNSINKTLDDAIVDGDIGGASTLQETYDQSTDGEIVLDSTRTSFEIRDNATPIASPLFEVLSNNQATNYLSVTSSGISLQTGVTVSSILDEDDMASNSATALATQQSIVAYVNSFPIANEVISPATSGAARLCSFDVATASSCSNVIGDCISSCANTGTGAFTVTWNTSYWSGGSYNCATTAVNGNVFVRVLTRSSTTMTAEIRTTTTAALLNSNASFVCHGIAP